MLHWLCSLLHTLKSSDSKAPASLQIQGENTDNEDFIKAQRPLSKGRMHYAFSALLLLLQHLPLYNYYLMFRFA